LVSKLLRAAAVTVAALVVSSTLTARAAEPFGATPCSGVQPGAWIEAPRGTIYTMGFVLKGIDAKGRSANYVTTVASYVFPTFGTKVWPTGAGPRAYNSAGRPIGSFVYAVHTETPDASSFGLVRLNKTVRANPQVCHFGGPTGINNTKSTTPTTVQYYGQGIPADSVTPARTGVVLNAQENDTLFMQGVIGIGDEGAPVVAGGGALGYFDGGVGGSVGVGGAGFVVARLGPWLTKAQKALKIRFTLQKARTL
jgi:hypothetical protein